MVRIEFDDIIRETSAFFERTKPPTGKTMELWYEEVRYIPSRAMSFITGEIKGLETWPRNLPAYIKAKHIEWKEKTGEDKTYEIHPRRINPQKYADQGCKLCGGKGVYPFPMDWPMRRDDEGRMLTRKFTPMALCTCTDAAEYGF